jgi:hypothetical protein
MEAYNPDWCIHLTTKGKEGQANICSPYLVDAV